MSTPTEPPPLQPPPTTSPRDIEAWRSFFTNSCIAMCIACPTLILLPPRKLDLYTFGLGVTFFMSAGFVCEQKTGQGLLWHIGNRIPSARNAERKEELRRQEEVERKFKIKEGGKREGEEKRGWVRRVWMGREGDGWVEERKRKEREALEGGRGYGGLIMDQIRELWREESGEREEDGEEEGKGDGEGDG